MVTRTGIATMASVVIASSAIIAGAAFSDEQTSPGSAAAVAVSGDNLEISHFIGKIEITTSSGANAISAELDPGRAVADGVIDSPKIVETSDGLKVMGDSDVKIKNCSHQGGEPQIQIKGHDKRSLDDFPSLKVTAPAGIDLELLLRGGAADIEDVNAASLSIQGCGDVEVGNVANKLEASVSGSGDIDAQTAGSLEASVRGSGDIDVGNVDDDATLNIAGSGEIVVGTLGGALSASIAGSGDIKTAGGDGPLSMTISGSGDIKNSGGSFTDASISIRGSGDVVVDGEVSALDVSVMGSGDIRVKKATGDVSVSNLGAGNINVNGKRWTRKGWVNP